MKIADLVVATSLPAVATDLLKITNGRISDNWHLEDNLTHLSKVRVATVEPKTL